MSLANKGIYHFGEFQLNLDLRVLVRRGERVPLGSKAYDVLTCLVANAGEVITKADLLTVVWADSFVEEGALSQQIFSLRKALGDKADYIVTIPGRGYRFMGAVRHVSTDTPPARTTGRETVLQETRERTHMVIEEPMPQTHDVPWKRASSHTGRYILVVTGVAAVGLLAGWTWSRRAMPRDHQEVVLADFLNTTGDPTFDRTLKRALEIDLGQSPYIDVLSERNAANSLRMMGLKNDTTITPDIAREICERTNRQVLLTGSISSLGQEYLLLLEAIDCNTGKKLASAKAEAKSKARVLSSLDSIADRVRSKLGESAKSIQGFDVPLEEAATPSLEALKAYSVGKYMQAQGKSDAESLQLFQRAAELDPQFPQAYGEIAISYYNLSEPRLAAEYMKKAFDLRDRVGTKEKLMIESHYYAESQEDMLAGIKAYQVWAATYPRDWVPWLDIANLETQLGQYEPSIAAGQRSLELEKNPIGYDVLARAYKDANRFAEAKALSQEAIHLGKDAPALHAILFQIAFHEHDAAALAREDQWLATHKDSLHDYYLAHAAAMEGKFALAEGLFHEEIAGERQEGLAEEADSIAIEEATIEREVGLPAVARVTLTQVGKETQASPDFAIERTLLGDIPFAERFLASHSNDAHPSTDMAYVQMPRLRAVLAMDRGKPLNAVAALEAPTPYGLPNISMQTQQAEAHLEAGQIDLAVARYKRILANPGASFFIEYPLAHLGLARCYAKEGDRADSRAEYESFLASWKDADPDLPVLKAAEAELAKLR